LIFCPIFVYLLSIDHLSKDWTQKDPLNGTSSNVFS